ncbi:THO complex subunit 2-like isoform X8 [Daphnia pulicaria]|uniref:THO complex subunit 2-like isoform X8 n=1 Tax=Daphnia pulicaria TaxID=35523 RepID=UPI001EECF34B|nr:THO complex subunit 2-like isoform X8 [Daphnia pulicaria]
MASLISQEVWKTWESHGHVEFVKLLESWIGTDNNSQHIPSIGSKDLFRAIYEFLWQAIKGGIKRELVLSTIGDILVLHGDLASLTLDVLNVIDHETLVNENNDERQKLCSMLKELENWLSDSMIKERLEIDTLQDCSLLKTKKIFYSRFIKVKTKLFYKQQKFNLLREENEGYAKLITELNQEIDDTITPLYILQVVQSLIGCFNLDPNRVLDVIMESFECRPQLHSRLFVPLIRSYMSDSLTLCEVLGFKFTSFDPSSTPNSLFVITALLLQHGVIHLEDIYRWLTPKDSEIDESAAKELADAKEYARRMNIIAVPKEDDKIEELIEERAPYNQKFGLCEALLSVGAWEQASTLLKRHPEFFVTSYRPISSSICKLVDYVIEPVYRTRCCISPKLSGKPVLSVGVWNFPKTAKEMKELRETAFPMLLSLGPHLYNDPVLLHKLIRLCNTALDDCGLNSSKKLPQDLDSLYFDVLTLFDVVILPSLALMESNCCVAEEIWNVLKKLPYEHRYRLYGLWKNDTFQSHSLLIRRKVDCVKRIKYIMKRVSKDNVKPTGRVLGKLSHSCPGFLFDYILSQIQIYDNLIGPVVDSLKYLTNLSYDVLGYCVLEALSNPDKERTNHDGTTISMWLTALSAFCGAIYKKYNIDLTGLLQYVANQLKAQKSLDLLILQEMVHKMGGIEASEEMTKEHMEAMQGGELLRAEAAHFGQVRVTKKAAQRLKETLLESNLAIPLCLLIAQQRNCVVYRETENNHLKLVGKLYDQCQDTLVQLGTFLALNMSVDDYVRRLPQLGSLLSDYHIHADVAFFLARPMFAHSINSKYDELRRAEKNSKNLLPAQKTQKYLEAVRLVMTPICESVRPLCAARVWEDLSPQFFATFWSLTVYDLSVPNAAYEREVQRLKVAIQQTNENRDLPASKRKKELDRCTALMDKLLEEEKKQKDHNERIMARLTQEKDSWFLCRSAKLAKTETITQFLQLCLFPRCVFTATDALFCARFVQLMHNLKTPNFSTLICYDRIFCDITYTVTSCTENEANRYGRFLCAMLETVMHWHSSKKIFDEECANYPGFVTKFRVGNQPSENNDHVDFENYRHVVHKWHHKIAKALVVCLESKDYVQIRNALIVLIRILPFFPVITPLVGVIDRNVEVVRSEQRDKRQDLSAMAISYSGQLKNKKTSIPEYEFHLVTRKPVTKTTPQSTNSLVVAANPGAQPENEWMERDREDRKERRNIQETEEERRERKGERKRKDRVLEDVLMDVKRRKEDEREKVNLTVRSPRHGNGSPSDGNADRRGHNRESPLSREASDRSFDRADRTERARRSTDSKRR